MQTPLSQFTHDTDAMHVQGTLYCSNLIVAYYMYNTIYYLLFATS